MVANSEALQSGAEEMSCTIDGATYSQGPFGYQGKCLMWLREHYAALVETDRSRVDDLLAGTGCESAGRLMVQAELTCTRRRPNTSRREPTPCRALSREGG